MNRKYELVYVVSPEATDEQIAELHTQVEGDRAAHWRPDREDRQLGPPQAGLRNRPSQGRHLRARRDQRLR